MQTSNDCIILGTNPVCAGEVVNYSSKFAGSNYVWQFTTNTAGASFCGPTNQQSVCVTTTQGGSYRLQLDYVFNNIPRQCAVEATVASALSIADLVGGEACLGDDVTFSTSILSGNGPYTYSWTFDNGGGPQTIAGATTDTLALTDVQIAQSGTYCVSVTGQCGTVTECALLTVTECGGGDTFCSLTQGAYGNPNGQFNGLNRVQLLTQLLSTSLTVGAPGRSLTIPAGLDGATCVIARLPANSGATTLPNFGDATLDTASCQTAPTALPLKNGRFKNILLGQVLTLSLNTRLDSGLSSVGVCGSITTVGEAGDYVTWTISANVLNALSSLGLPQTVGGILALGNRALGGLSTGGASLSEVSGAADVINNAFDECRTLVACF